MREGPEPCAACGALPCDQSPPPLINKMSAAITLLYTHGALTRAERDAARRRLNNQVSA